MTNQSLIEKKNWGGGDFFFEKERGAKTFFRQIFPKTRPRYPVNFDRSLIPVTPRGNFGDVWGEVQTHLQISALLRNSRSVLVTVTT